jgi:transcriptional regulator with XRE-family HTH domain
VTSTITPVQAASTRTMLASWVASLNAPCRRCGVLAVPPSPRAPRLASTSMDNRKDVRDFLVSRRARISPGQAGLPAYGDRRRVPGLRREEVASLAGVSIDYYARLERGNLGGVSDSVLDAVATALQLDEAERQHLRELARVNTTPATRSTRTRRPAAPIGIRASLREILNGMTAVPAYVRNARMDVLAANDLCVALYDGILSPTSLPVNLARFGFLDGRAHGLFRDWDEVADGLVGALRAEAGRNPLDKDLTGLVGELTARSDVFATLWARHNVIIRRTAVKVLHNQTVGDIELTCDALDLPGDGLTLIAYTAAPGSRAHEQLAILASWNHRAADRSTSTGA